MGQHTPGPWRAVRGTDLVFVEVVNLAHVGVTDGDANNAPFIIQARPGSEGSRAHNAMLMATAPELAEAADAAETLLGSLQVNENHEVRVALRAALAKAGV